MSKNWIVSHRNELQRVVSDRVSVNAGALVFENGTYLESELVCAVAPDNWDLLIPEPEDDCTCGDDHDDDD